MFSIGLSMRVRPGCFAEYKEAHNNLWPDLAESMEVNNVSMAIYRFEDQLFLHAVAPTEDDWEKSRNVEVLDRWSEYMAKLLETDADGNIVFHELSEAFAFGTFKK
jgi:L-rhamnose mutarotase